MSHDIFLHVLTQLSGAKRARCVMDDQIIFIDRGQKNRWIVSTKVFFGEGYLPPSIRDCIASSGVLRWQEKGATLRLDPLSKSVYLHHEIDAAKRYTHFCYLMKDFVSQAKEWRTLFDDLASQDLRHSL